MTYSILSRRQRNTAAAYVLPILFSSSLLGACASEEKKQSSPFLDVYQEQLERTANTSSGGAATQTSAIERIIDATVPEGATLNQKATTAKDLSLKYLVEGKNDLALTAITLAEKTLSQAPLVQTTERYSLLDARGRVLLAEGKLDDAIMIYEQAFLAVAPLDTERTTTLKQFAETLGTTLEAYLTTGTEQEQTVRKNSLAEVINERLSNTDATSDEERARNRTFTAITTTSPTSKTIAYETARLYTQREREELAPQQQNTLILEKETPTVSEQQSTEQTSPTTILYDLFQTMTSRRGTPAPLVNLPEYRPTTNISEPALSQPAQQHVFPFDSTTGDPSEMGKKFANLVAEEIKQRTEQETPEPLPEQGFPWSFLAGEVLIALIGFGAGLLSAPLLKMRKPKVAQ